MGVNGHKRETAAIASSPAVCVQPVCGGQARGGAKGVGWGQNTVAMSLPCDEEREGQERDPIHPSPSPTVARTEHVVCVKKVLLSCIMGGEQCR